MTDYFFNTYKRLDEIVIQAEGPYLILKNNRHVLDMAGGLGVNLLGYGNTSVIDAIERQISKYIHLSNYFYQESQSQLAEKLITLTGYSKIFFTNSGTEATEASIKIVRKYFRGTPRKTLISFTGSFHGRTMGSLSLTAKERYRESFQPLLSDVLHVEFNSPCELNNALNYETAAVFIECIQGEGGVNLITDEFAGELNYLHEKFGFILIADEIQSGMGRTGKFFAFEHFGLKPDLVLVAKGLGGGLPLGAMLGNAKVADVFSPGDHGSTFGGNPVSCAAGFVVINEIVTRELMRNSLNIGEYILGGLEDLSRRYPAKLISVRGKGLMIGAELSFNADVVVAEMLKKGVLVNSASGNVIRLLPPLIITTEHADMFLKSFREVIETVN
ncbi:MAG: acetylornithine/succinylornithine family transaminase [Ignavibacteria bacterium]|nr:acetylornithine/succinylornithine family transaminase [Ignavibacteria bacterium]